MNIEDLLALQKKLSELNEIEETLRNLHLQKLAKGEIQGPPVGYASIDKPWLKYYTEDAIKAEIPQETAYEYLYNKNKNRLNNNAIKFFGKNFSYAQLFTEINKYASAFKNYGIKKGEIVSICMPTSPETIFMFYALNKIGAITDMLDPRSNPEQLKYYLNENKSKLLLIYEPCIVKTNNLSQETKIKKIITVQISNSMPAPIKQIYNIKERKNRTQLAKQSYKITNFLNEYSKPELCNEIAKNEQNIALIVHSSGTTSIPKGIKLSNKNLNSISLQYDVSSLKTEAKARFLSIIPAFASFGMIASVHLPLTLGMENIIEPVAAQETFYKLVKKHKPNFCLTVPRYYETLIDKKLNFQNFYGPGCGGDGISLKREKQINDTFQKNGGTSPLLKGWGMSELSSTACLEIPECHQLGSVGIPLVKNIIKIVDPETHQELPYNEKGEICVNGPTMMLGYLNNDEKTKHTIVKHEDGKLWVHSRDIGHMSSAGILTHDSRIDGMIVRYDGFKIYPPALENVIMKHPLVDKCIIINYHDEKIGNVPKAHIVLKNADTIEYDLETIELEIKEICKNNLAERAIPYYYQFDKELLYTPMGKVDFKKMEEQNESKQEKTKIKR